MTTVLLIVDNTASTQNCIVNDEGNPMIVNLGGARQVPITAILAGQLMACGLPVPKTGQELINSIKIFKALGGEQWYTHVVPAGDLSLNLDRKGDDDYKYDNKLIVRGWKEIHVEDKWVEGLHLDLNLTKLDEEFFGTFEGGYEDAHLHIDLNVGLEDGTLDEYSLNILRKYDHYATEYGIESTCGTQGDRTYKHQWETWGASIDYEGKERKLYYPTANISVGSAMYCLLDYDEETARWTRQAVALRDKNGELLTREGEVIRGSSFGFINSKLNVRHHLFSEWKRTYKSSQRRFKM